MTSDDLPAALPIPGIRLGTARAGIKKPDHRDLVVIELAEGTTTAAVFTRNAFCAAPVIVAREHLAQGAPRYLLVNTGNANAGTGEAGLCAARECCAALAGHGGCEAEQVLPFSTGVIGEDLPVARITAALPAALEALDADGWDEASWGILTTDTRPKRLSRTLEIDGRSVTLTGMAKGAGMIRPNMATMLAYIATDAALAPELLQYSLQAAVDVSFNRITVDGDTSTNDACVLMATGRSGVVLEADTPALAAWQAALTELCEELAKGLVRDGEGATKLIHVEVTGGVGETECLEVAWTVAHSPLVKTAFFAADPNWGRILAAVGRAPVPHLDVQAVQIWLDEVRIVTAGGRDPAYREERGQAVVDRNEITVRIDLARGAARARVWTCDFSYDYVRINAEYRT